MASSPSNLLGWNTVGSDGKAPEPPDLICLRGDPGHPPRSRALEPGDLSVVLQGESDRVQPVEQAVLLEPVDLEAVLSAEPIRDRLRLEVHAQLIPLSRGGRIQDLPHPLLREGDRQKPDLRRIVREDVAKRRRDDHPEAVFLQRPGCMLAGRPAAKIPPGHEHGPFAVFVPVQHEIRVRRPVVPVPLAGEEELPVPRPLDALQVPRGDDLVGVDIAAVERHHDARVLLERRHPPYTPHSRTSTKWPATAAAAAIGGLTRCVRPPGPCRPSKFRFEVEAHRSPGPRMSGFIPRHIEQPASRHSNPAVKKTRWRPSRSATALTCWDPGTTIARTFGLTLRPATTWAAARRSSSLALVQEPMNTRSMAISRIGVPGRRAMYSRARSIAWRRCGSGCAPGSGTRPVTGSDCDWLVPQV